MLLKRELIVHLHALNSTEIKVYIALLILADPRTGSLKIPLKDLAARIGLSYRLTNKSILRLKEMKQIHYSSDRVLKESIIQITGFVPVQSFFNESGTDALPENFSSNPENSKQPVPIIPQERVTLDNPEKESSSQTAMNDVTTSSLDNLILQIATDLGVQENPQGFRTFCENYLESTLRKAFEEVQKLPADKVRNRKAEDVPEVVES